jgi:hypothetical protein
MIDTIAFGMQYQVLKPALVAPNIVMNIRLASGYDSAVVVPQIQSGCVSYVNGLPIGTSGTNLGLIYLSQIEYIALSTPGVVAVEPNSVTIGGVEDDYQLSAWQEALITATNVSVGMY